MCLYIVYTLFATAMAEGMRFGHLDAKVDHWL
jgi:hypothetical protein